MLRLINILVVATCAGILAYGYFTSDTTLMLIAAALIVTGELFVFAIQSTYVGFGFSALFWILARRFLTDDVEDSR